MAVVAATAWDMTALSSEALDRDALEVSIARRLADLNRVTQDLEVAQVSSPPSTRPGGRPRGRGRGRGRGLG